MLELALTLTAARLRNARQFRTRGEFGARSKICSAKAVQTNTVYFAKVKQSQAFDIVVIIIITLYYQQWRLASYNGLLKRRALRGVQAKYSKIGQRLHTLRPEVPKHKPNSQLPAKLCRLFQVFEEERPRLL